MEATIFCSSPKPFSLKKPCNQRSKVVALNGGSGTNGRDYGGKLVDENMIALRLRIKEMKMLESCNNPPSHWMEWEKKYVEHRGYLNDVCGAIGLLQIFLMNVTPSLALGMVLLVALSVPISVSTVLFQAMELYGRILAGSSSG